jgi:hypothetical protein
MDLTAQAAPDRPGARVAVGAGLVGLALVLVVILTGAAALTLVGCVVAGAGLTYLSGLPLKIEERLAYGTVVGAVAVACADFVVALVAGLGLGAVLVGLALALAASAPGWWLGRTTVAAELSDAADRWRRREPWPLWALLAVCWPFTLVLLGRSYQVTAQGLVAGNPGAYADWAAHLTYAGSFAYGHNFPPEFPVDPGHRMAYSFMIDFLAATLVPLGTALTSALVLTSGLLGLAFPPVMYLAGLRLVRSRVGAALAVLVFTLSGGLGFATVLGDVGRLGLGALVHLPRLATLQPELNNIQWLNPVLAWMVPQRSVLFGFSLALIVMALLWIALREDHAAGWAPFAFAGVVAGLTPAFHLHAYGTIVVLAGFWAVLAPRRQWAAFFVPALVLGLPAVLWMSTGGAATVQPQTWWLADTGGHHDGPVLFWLKNTGPLVPAMAVAFLWRGVLPAGLALFLAPIWLWFLVPNFLVFQPWDWDNTKFFAYWALFGALAVGALLAHLGGIGAGGRALAAALAVLLMLAGGLDLARTLDPTVSSSLFTDTAGIQAANWVRANTDPRAVFLVAPNHNEPIPTLGGRRVMVGYGGWLWTYGLKDWEAKTADAQRMLRGDPATPELLRRYDVRYVVLGPQEINGLGASPAYWDQTADRVYSSGGYVVYRVR